MNGESIKNLIIYSNRINLNIDTSYLCIHAAIKSLVPRVHCSEIPITNKK